MKDSSFGYINLGWQFFTFKAWNVSFYALLVFRVSIEKYASMLLFLWVYPYMWFAASLSLSLSLCVSFSILGLELRAFTLSHSTSSIFCDRIFQNRVLQNICLGCLQSVLLLIFVSWIAKIIDVSHWHLAAASLLQLSCKSLSLFCIFNALTMICLGVFLFCFCLFDALKTSWTWITLSFSRLVKF
jgi:hypothetical protein